MYICLNKKITLAEETKLSSVEWNNSNGYIACGGEDGVIRILSISSESTKENTPIAGIANGVSMNQNLNISQTLESHKNPVCLMLWNKDNQKLFSADVGGAIVIWAREKNSLVEEVLNIINFNQMSNDKKKNSIVSMKWSRDYEHICILYSEGTVLMGNAQGGKVWSTELKTTCSQLLWTPDSKKILIFTTTGKTLLYDMNGNPLLSTNYIANESFFLSSDLPVSSDWYNGANGYYLPDGGYLAVALTSGKILLCTGVSDSGKLIIII